MIDRLTSWLLLPVLGLMLMSWVGAYLVWRASVSLRKGWILPLLLLIGCDDPAPATPSHVILTLSGRCPVAGQVFRKVLSGCSARITEQQAADLAQRPDVVSITASREVHATGWGLDRINQRALPLDGNVSFPNGGEGVTIYVLDTGFFLHPDFAGRSRASGFDSFGGDGRDCHGHSTHVSGIAVGSTLGVARAATVVTVRVLDCNGSGSTEGVIRGLDWVAVNAERPAVVNMSIGTFLPDTAVNTAVDNLVRAGIPVIAAAGNSGVDACESSPAGAALAITVGATNINDNQTFFSNHGQCVDLFAPGEDIVSAWIDGGTRELDGTSMAAPHVAGACALIIHDDPTCTSLVAFATPGINADPQLLLFTGAGLNVPTNLAVQLFPAGHLHVVWTYLQDDGQDMFELERSTDNGVTWEQAAVFGPAERIGYVTNPTVRIFDLFRLRAMRQGHGGPWSLRVSPIVAHSSAERHVH